MTVSPDGLILYANGSKMLTFFILESLLFVMIIIVLLRRLVLVVASRLYQSLPENETLPPYQVAVLVPCRNEEKSIVATLESLAQVEVGGNSMNVIVFDDGSTDSTHQIVDAFVSQHPNFQVRSSPRGRAIGKAAVIRAVVEELSDEIEVLWVLDADHSPDPQYLIRALAYLKCPDVAAVATSNRVVNGNASYVATYNHLEAVVHEMTTCRGKHMLNLCPPLMGVWCARLTALRDLFSGDWLLADDANFTVAIVAAGLRIVYAADAVTYHSVPTKIGGYFDQHIRWNRGFYQVLRRRLATLLQPERRVPVLRRIETIIYTLGYIDRILLGLVILTALVLWLLGKSIVVHLVLLGLYVAVVLLQILVAILSEPGGYKMLPRLPFALSYCALDMLVAIIGIILTLLRHPLEWKRAERS